MSECSNCYKCLQDVKDPVTGLATKDALRQQTVTMSALEVMSQAKLAAVIGDTQRGGSDNYCLWQLGLMHY